MGEDDRRTIAGNFLRQADLCATNGAPTYAAIVRGLAHEVETGNLLDPFLAQWIEATSEETPPLRVTGALHRLVLDGRAPDLAAVFPTAGGQSDPDRAWSLARPVIARELSLVADYLRRPPQTNEVQRSSALLGGFLTVAAETGLPLRLLELGASAGLNLLWDHYRIEAPNFAYGPEDSPLSLVCGWDGPSPPLPEAMIAERRGCDRDPIDVRQEEDRRRLCSYIWAEQPERLERLRRAIGVALDHPVAVDRAELEQWVPEQLQRLPEGQCTVVFHSSVWAYLPDETRQTVSDIIHAAGERATAAAPLAWLRMEGEGLNPYAEISLTLWPGGTTRILGTAHFHGGSVRWYE